MNLLFITLDDIRSIDEYGIYEDLLREFSKNGHHIYVVSPTESGHHEKTHLIKQHNAIILKVKTGKIQKTNIIEKGISTILLESQYVSAIKKFLNDVKFDLILYSTPPITLANAVQFIKKRDGAKTYLLLKDIFPQNAIDIEMMRKTGIKGLLYMYFRLKEKKLYEISDYIGCMSPANVAYVIKYNPEVVPNKVMVCPNCVEPRDLSITLLERDEIRNKYGIPLDKKVFVYGGNLGRPQGIPFLIECLKMQENNQEAFFLIIGDGTEYGKLDSYIKESDSTNVKLMKQMMKTDYDRVVAACDVGLIFLDYRFTIPNFPSRLLSYMQAKIPVLCVTDRNTDIGKIAIEAGFGWMCESNNCNAFDSMIKKLLQLDLQSAGEKAFEYMHENYSASNSYQIIMHAIQIK